MVQLKEQVIEVPTVIIMVLVPEIRHTNMFLLCKKKKNVSPELKIQLFCRYALSGSSSVASAVGSGSASLSALQTAMNGRVLCSRELAGYYQRPPGFAAANFEVFSAVFLYIVFLLMCRLDGRDVVSSSPFEWQFERTVSR